MLYIRCLGGRVAAQVGVQWYVMTGVPYWSWSVSYAVSERGRRNRASGGPGTAEESWKVARHLAPRPELITYYCQDLAAEVEREDHVGDSEPTQTDETRS